MIALIEFLGDPYLDERLTSDTESGRLPVEFGDHPCREIDVHTPVFLTGAPCPSRIQSGRDVLAASNRSSNSLAFIKCHLALWTDVPR